MKKQEKIKTYQANPPPLTPARVLATMLEEVSSSRHVLWQLFRREFQVQFRQQLLGYFWVLIVPLITVGQFIFMHEAGVLSPGEVDLPYGAFAFFGLGLWGVLIQSVEAVSKGLVTNADLVVRTHIPKISLAVSGLSNALYQILINVCLLCVVLIFFGVVPSAWALLYPVLILPILIIGISLGLVASVFGAVIRDVSRAVSLVLGFAMFVTPVLYMVPPHTGNIIGWLFTYNPMTYLINTPRNLFFKGQWVDVQIYCSMVGLSVVALIASLWIFYAVKDKVVEQL